MSSNLEDTVDVSSENTAENQRRPAGLREKLLQIGDNFLDKVGIKDEQVRKGYLLGLTPVGSLAEKSVKPIAERLGADKDSLTAASVAFGPLGQWRNMVYGSSGYLLMGLGDFEGGQLFLENSAYILAAAEAVEFPLRAYAYKKGTHLPSYVSIASDLAPFVIPSILHDHGSRLKNKLQQWKDSTSEKGTNGVFATATSTAEQTLKDYLPDTEEYYKTESSSTTYATEDTEA